MSLVQKLSVEEVQSWLTPRPRDAHKGLFGHVLVVGGDRGMPGAVRLAAEASLRVGAGIVSVVTHADHVMGVISSRPELLCYGVEQSMDVLDLLLTRATVIVLGPGLGQSTWSHALFERVVQASQPLIVDADALNLLASTPKKHASWILTPHPGEAARLLNTTILKIQEDREAALHQLTHMYGGVVVLKGSETLIGTEKQPVKMCVGGNPGMSSAGMGDVLSGIIAGFVGQGVSLWQAAQAGVVLHAEAGDRVAARQGQRGMLASDLWDELPCLVNPGEFQQVRNHGRHTCDREKRQSKQ